jgi:hypothetical protein
MNMTGERKRAGLVGETSEELTVAPQRHTHTMKCVQFRKIIIPYSRKCKLTNTLFVKNSKLFKWKQGVTRDYHSPLEGLDPMNI